MWLGELFFSSFLPLLTCHVWILISYVLQTFITGSVFLAGLGSSGDPRKKDTEDARFLSNFT